jgi:hypothetical protein
MGNIAACLHPKDEVFRYVFSPGFEGLLFGEFIKGVIYFNSIEMMNIVKQ